MASNLIISRLREIETAADQARKTAITLLEDCGYTWQRDIDLATLGAAAALLTHHIVEHRRNLHHQGERVAGLLHEANGQRQLLYEAYEPIARQRFSIAHELGHFFLHQSPQAASSSDIELEADAFAAAFLLPAECILADLAYFGQSTAFLARRYNVSEVAVKHRLATLEQLSTESTSTAVVSGSSQ